MPLISYHPLVSICFGVIKLFLSSVITTANSVSPHPQLLFAAEKITSFFHKQCFFRTRVKCCLPKFKIPKSWPITLPDKIIIILLPSWSPKPDFNIFTNPNKFEWKTKWQILSVLQLYQELRVNMWHYFTYSTKFWTYRSYHFCMRHNLTHGPVWLQQEVLHVRIWRFRIDCREHRNILSLQHTTLKII